MLFFFLFSIFIQLFTVIQYLKQSKKKKKTSHDQHVYYFHDLIPHKIDHMASLLSAARLCFDVPVIDHQSCHELLNEAYNLCPFAGLPLFGVRRCFCPGAEFGAALLSALAED